MYTACLRQIVYVDYSKSEYSPKAYLYGHVTSKITKKIHWSEFLNFLVVINKLPHRGAIRDDLGPLYNATLNIRNINFNKLIAHC